MTMTPQQRRSWERLHQPYRSARRIYRREEIEKLQADIAWLREQPDPRNSGECAAMVSLGEAMLASHYRLVSRNNPERD